MNLLRLTETALHIGGCLVLLFGVIVTIFVMAGFTELRPLGLHPIQFGLIFAGMFGAAGAALLVASTVIRKRYFPES